MPWVSFVTQSFVHLSNAESELSPCSLRALYFELAPAQERTLELTMANLRLGVMCSASAKHTTESEKMGIQTLRARIPLNESFSYSTHSCRVLRVDIVKVYRQNEIFKDSARNSLLSLICTLELQYFDRREKRECASTPQFAVFTTWLAFSIRHSI